MREGRAFSQNDGDGAPPVAIVNEAFARKWWPRESAVGHRIKLGGPYIDGSVIEIVGVAGNVTQLGLDTQAGPEIFLPHAQDGSEAMVLMIRTAADPGRLAGAVRRRVFAIDRNLPIQSLQPFEKSLAATLQRRRFGTLLLTLFAALAMLLAAVGVCGLLSYWVSVREDEIAIRLILGAPRAVIARWVGGQALRLAGAGVVVGGIGCWFASQWMATLVFGVSARNPATMMAAGAAVVGIAFLAAAIPVWRATRIGAAERLHHS
jgi:hypothetical protein